MEALSFNDNNGNPLRLSEVILLSKRFGSTIYQAKFIVPEKLTVDALIKRTSMNLKVKRIICQEHLATLLSCEIPILGQRIFWGGTDVELGPAEG